MATGASDGWRMNRRLSIGSTGATAWSKWPLAKPLDLTPANAPTPVGCSGASVADLPVPLLTAFHFRSDPVNVAPMDTPTLFLCTIGPSGA